VGEIYTPDDTSQLDYSSFGMMMVGRSWESGTGYKYGFNGKENEDEITGNDNIIDYGARIYDPRLGRWLSVDPLKDKYVGLSCYSLSANNPIAFIDVDGREFILSIVVNYQGPVPTTVHDLGSTSLKRGDIHIAFNDKTNEYDITLNVQISYSQAFQGENNIEDENPGLFKEIDAHERGHADQLFEAAQKDITIKFMNGDKEVTYTGKADEVFTQLVTEYGDQLSKEYTIKVMTGQMTKEDAAAEMNSRLTTVLKDAALQTSKQISTNISDMNNDIPAVEADANNRATKKLGEKDIKYLNRNQKTYYKGKELEDSEIKIIFK